MSCLTLYKQKKTCAQLNTYEWSRGSSILWLSFGTNTQMLLFWSKNSIWAELSNSFFCIFHLSILNKESKYASYQKPPTLLPPTVPFTQAKKSTPCGSKQNKLVNLCVDDFVSMWYSWIKNIFQFYNKRFDLIFNRAAIENQKPKEKMLHFFQKAVRRRNSFINKENIRLVNQKQTFTMILSLGKGENR